jgi:large subunit ribosomal protein L21e
MTRSHGSRRKSRSVLTKSNVLRGITYLLINYKIGDKVMINIDPSEHNTMPHRRYQGKIGTILEVGKRIVRIAIQIGNKEKILQTKRNHIKLITN